MSVPVIQEDSLGIIIRIAVTDPNTLDEDGEEEPLDLSGATVVFVMLSPDDPPVRTVKTATVESPASAGNASYITVTGDLETPGTWQIQARITFSVSQVYYSEVARLKVKANL